MKKRGEKLEGHYSQAFDSWLQLVLQRPRYVVLCNFDEYWVYDFDTQLEERGVSPTEVRIELDPVRVVAFD